MTATSFAVPEGSLGYWTERLIQHGVRFEKPGRRFDQTVLAFEDPDGLAVELVARPGTGAGEVWAGSPVPAEHAIREISGVTLSERAQEVTSEFLTGFLGFEKVGEENGDRIRYLTASGHGTFAYVLDRPEGPVGQTAVGTVHRVAWRAPDDRNYLHSIYFREPGGGLFEIATDPPGFAVDEDPDHLGESLKLPPWPEKNRARIEQVLPSFTCRKNGAELWPRT